MASTNASTSASALPRILALKNQFKIAFKRIYDYSDEKIKPYLVLIEKQKIDYITFWAYSIDSNGEEEKWCELALYVDWEKHRSYLLAGEKEVIFKPSWNGTAPEVDSAIDTYLDYVDYCSTNYQSLTSTFSVGFAEDVSGAEHDSYMKLLGLVKGKSVKWKKGINTAQYKTIVDSRPREIKELTVKVTIKEP